MSASCCAVLVAAGGSVRMGEPKQFLPLLGRPAIAWTLSAFERAQTVSSVVLVVRPEDRPRMERVVEECRLQKPVFFACGGGERQASVRSGVLSAPQGTGLAAIHDGARPLVTPEQIDTVVRAVTPPAGAALAVRVKDTIKVADENGAVLSTPDRSALWAVQTPQVFPWRRFCEEIERALRENRLYTDDCQLWEHAGLPVRLCEGSYENLKLTTREDLLTAEGILRRRENLL